MRVCEMRNVRSITNLWEKKKKRTMEKIFIVKKKNFFLLVEPVNLN